MVKLCLLEFPCYLLDELAGALRQDESTSSCGPSLLLFRPQVKQSVEAGKPPKPRWALAFGLHDVFGAKSGEYPVRQRWRNLSFLREVIDVPGSIRVKQECLHDDASLPTQPRRSDLCGCSTSG